MLRFGNRPQNKIEQDCGEGSFIAAVLNGIADPAAARRRPRKAARARSLSALEPA
jgi:hypothetical protein